jgi:hypothetical protein
MKLFVKLMLALLVLAFLLPFTLLKDEEGNTLLSFSNLSMPDLKLPQLSSGKEFIPSQIGSGTKDTFYKWYDPGGNVQFTSEPPPTGVAYTVKQYDPDANVIQAVNLLVEKTAEPTQSAAVEKSPPKSVNPYNSKGIGKIFEDTRNIETLLHQRTESQNDIINQ